MPTSVTPRIDPTVVVNLWLDRQGLSTPRGHDRLTKRRLIDHLERTGGLQVDPIQAVDRAHYLTLWSRFGSYARSTVDRWVYRDRIGYEYWAHEASIIPAAHLSYAARRMRGFPPPEWAGRSWWKVYATSPASKRRVLTRLRRHGPLTSSDLDNRVADRARPSAFGNAMPMPGEDKRSLRLLWHDGRIAVTTRRQFHRVYDLAERVYPRLVAASPTAYEDSWLLRGLSGNGVATERHLTGYITGPPLNAAARRRTIARHLKTRRIVEVAVAGRRGRYYALPEMLDRLDSVPEPTGTTLICPFDSLLWQRDRASELLGFHYRLEIYVPAAKREFGYYAMPILHDGALVGRLDPQLIRDREELVVHALALEPGVRRTPSLTRGLRDTLASLAEFAGATRLRLPRGWRQLE